MEYNKQNLKVGDIARLDVGHRNSCLVYIVRLSPRELFATVRLGKEEWDIMIFRLSKTHETMEFSTREK